MTKKIQENLQHLYELVQKFEQLDKNLWSSSTSPDFDAIKQILDAKLEIKKLLDTLSLVNVDKDFSAKIKKIRDDYGYNIDGYFELLEKYLGEKFSQAADEKLDWRDALFEEGTADYVDESFFRRRNEIGALIVNEQLPDTFLHLLEKLKECYALGLFEATIIFCRAVIETGLFEALKKKEKIQSGRNVRDLAEFSLKDLMVRVEPLADSKIYKWTKEVIRDANNILHSKHSKVAPSEKDAYLAIKTSFALLEDLFR